MGVTRLEIDLKALKHNYSYLRAKVADNIKMMAVVKAFGYGSDACEIALFLEKLGVDYFAVAYADEGEILRKAGVKTPILVLHPQIQNIAEIVKHRLEPSLYNFEIFEAFLKYADETPLMNYPVHIKFNTGLNRLGFWHTDVPTVLSNLKESNNIKVISVFSDI